MIDLVFLDPQIGIAIRRQKKISHGWQSRTADGGHKVAAAMLVMLLNLKSSPALLCFAISFGKAEEEDEESAFDE